jgi:hypothetical protein
MEGKVFYRLVQVALSECVLSSSAIFHMTDFLLPKWDSHKIEKFQSVSLGKSRVLRLIMGCVPLRIGASYVGPRSFGDSTFRFDANLLYP